MRKQNSKRLLFLCLALVLLVTAALPALAASEVHATIKYVTGAKNKTVAKSVTVTGHPGDVYQAKVKTVKGYTFIGYTNENSKNFVFGNKDATVLAHYAKNVKATVKYVDQDGDKIAESTSLSGYEGKSYTVPQPYMQGYTFDHVSDAKHGVFGTSNHTISVVYRSNRVQPINPVTTAHLLVQSVNRDNGAVLEMIVNQDVAYGSTVNLGSYQHAVRGYTFSSVYVNGVPANTSSVRVTGNTTITYYYYSTQPWPVPVTEYAHLTIYAADTDSDQLIKVLRDKDVEIGTSIALNPPSISGYDYQYTLVDGSLSYDRTITVTYDTSVTYYYEMIPLTPDPDPVPVMVQD